MRRTTLAAIAAPLLALALASCSSSSSSSAPAATTTHSSPAAMTGTETLTAVDTGSAAAANLNNSNPNAPLNFTKATWAGPVNVTVKPFTLPGGGGNNGNAAATATFVTPAGNITLHHSANQVPGASNPNSPPPATWTKSGTTCYFVATFSKGTGTFLSGTGKFSGAHGTFTYLVTAQGYAPLASGKTTCSFPDVGNVQNNGAQIKFLVTGPLTVKA
jgi:hypothetical protein